MNGGEPTAHIVSAAGGDGPPQRRLNDPMKNARVTPHPRTRASVKKSPGLGRGLKLYRCRRRIRIQSGCRVGSRFPRGMRAGAHATNDCIIPKARAIFRNDAVCPLNSGHRTSRDASDRTAKKKAPTMPGLSGCIHQEEEIDTEGVEILNLGLRATFNPGPDPMSPRDLAARGPESTVALRGLATPLAGTALAADAAAARMFASARFTTCLVAPGTGRTRRWSQRTST